MEIDKVRAEAFAGRMVNMLNEASLALMTSIGHQTGLFDTMAGLSPATSPQIAEAAGLNERYVREWLGAMVTGGIIEYDPAAGTYGLPPEHAAALTRAAGPENMALYAQYISLLANVEEGVAECFRNGGGVPYSAYPRFQRLQSEDSSSVFDATLIDRTFPAFPGVMERLQSGIDVADVGCGCGHAVNLMARAFPGSRFTGFDFSEEGVSRGRAEAEQWALGNARFEAKDAAMLDAAGQYDLITAFDAIHDQAHPRKVLRAIARALRPDGQFLMVDVAASSRLHENLDHPLGPFLYTVSCLHCMTVSLALNGEGLGAMWGEQKARELLAEAGFTAVEVQTIPGDMFNKYFLASKSS